MDIALVGFYIVLFALAILVPLAITSAVTSLVVTRSLKPVRSRKNLYVLVAAATIQIIVLYFVTTGTSFSGDMAFAAGAGAAIAISWILVGCLVAVSVYPPLFVWLMPLQSKKAAIKWLLLFYVVLYSPYWVNILARELRVGWHAQNVAFYGQVTDIDRNPIAGAEIHAGNCTWLEPESIVADSNGEFSLTGRCNLLIIEDIKDPATGKHCLSSYGRRSDPGQWVTSVSTSGRQFDNGDDSFVFDCVWHWPADIQILNSHARLETDGHAYVLDLAKERAFEKLGPQSGAKTGLLHVSLSKETPGTEPGSVVVTVWAETGGVQEASSDLHTAINIAPNDGYEPSLSWVLEPDDYYFGKTVLFHGHDRQVYGYFRFSIRPDLDEQQRLTVSFEARANSDGSRAILTHIDPYGFPPMDSE